jgi:gamma-glutamylcyclotransferase
MIHYFAYGSNLHPARLTARVPSAELIGVATYAGHRLDFHKKSDDGSSKCNMFKSGSESDLTHGAIYRMRPEHKHELDRVEGKGYGYRDSQVALDLDGKEYDCFTYFAQESHIVDELAPYHWYKQLVILGARYLGLPGSYISSLDAVGSVDDPDATRRKANEMLIETIINYR